MHDEELQVLADELASWLSCREDDERDAALDVLERETHCCRTRTGPDRAHRRGPAGSCAP
jgi:hypothetical protein